MTRPAKLPHICTQLAFDRETQVCPACAGTTEDRARATQALLDEKAEIDRAAAELLRSLSDWTMEVVCRLAMEDIDGVLRALGTLRHKADRINHHWSRQ